MALRDRMPFNLPFGGNPPTAGDDEFIGNTKPEPRPEAIPSPVADALPIGASGRANFWGFSQSDELNPDLIGPRGLRRFEDMYRSDPHVRRLVLAAWSPLVAGTWSLEPYGGDDTTDYDRQIADDIWWMLTEFMKPNFYGHLLEIGALLIRSGFLSAEQLWTSAKRDGKTLLAPRKLMVHKPMSIWRWWQDDYGELTHIGQQLPNRGEVVIPATDLQYYRLGAEGDNWQGTPLLRHAYKPWVMKDRLERIDSVGQERKAVGVPICYPPKGATPAQKQALEMILSNLHLSEAAYVMMPGPKAGSTGANGTPEDEWLIDVIKFDSSSGEGIMNSIAYHQTAIAASFLTDFLELGHHQVGARATAEVQEDPFITAINGALLPPVLPPLNALVDRIRRENYDKTDGSPTLKLTLHDEASLSEIAAYVVPLIQAEAMQVDPELEDYLRERGNLPKANSDVRAARQKAQQAGLDAAAQLAAKGEEPGAEPPSPNADPAAPANQGPSAPGKPAQPNPIVGAVKATGEAPRGGNAPQKPAAQKTLDTAAGPVAGGVIVHAADTGRVLTVQRAADDTDSPDVFCSYEFPGGKLDDGEDPKAGALREWGEETGASLPDGARWLGDLDSPDGRYRAFVTRIPAETDLQLARPDRDEVSATRWADPSSLADGATSDRMRQLLPGLADVLQLDAPAPMSGGVADASGLQMVPEVRVTKCVCGKGPYGKDGVCRACGGTQPPKALDDAAAEPSSDWFERLVSQDRLREAFDGCRDHIQAACLPETLDAARKLAHQAANGVDISQGEPPEQLVDALAGHYMGLYQLGQETVADELARQRRSLKTLDDPAPSAAAAGEASRLARARQRGQHSARNIVGKIRETLGRDQITGLKDAAALQAAADQAATGALRSEALSNATAMVTDGRADAAAADGSVVGGIYTSVLDERSCDPCIAADTGDVLAMDQALALGPPNPNCEGQDRCRCLILWVLSSDPAAIQAIS